MDLKIKINLIKVMDKNPKEFKKTLLSNKGEGDVEVSEYVQKQRQLLKEITELDENDGLYDEESNTND